MVVIYFRKSTKPVGHWLERAAPNYSSQTIKSVRSFCKVAVIFGPIVFFWALFDQQVLMFCLENITFRGLHGFFKRDALTEE